MHMKFDPNSKAEEIIQFNDFLKIDIRLGEIIDVEDFPEARNPSYKIKIDFGNGIGVKKSSAQITHLYNKNKLIHKKVMAVVNFPPRQIGKFMSEVLILGFSNKNGEIVLMDIDGDIPLGSRLH